MSDFYLGNLKKYATEVLIVVEEWYQNMKWNEKPDKINYPTERPTDLFFVKSDQNIATTVKRGGLELRCDFGILLKLIIKCDFELWHVRGDFGILLELLVNCL